MKIGVDIKWIFNGPPSGKVVVKQLVKELLTEKYNHLQFYFFLDKKDKDKTFPFPKGNHTFLFVSNINNLISNAFVLPKYAKKYKLDIVLFQNFGTFSSINSSVYIHDLLYLDFPQYYSFKERLYLSLIKPLAKKAKSIITISESEKERILKHQLGEKNVHYVHHGVDPKFKPISHHNPEQIIDFKKAYDLPNEFILYLGRLNIRKNIIGLINAMKHVELPLVIIGSYNHKSHDLDMRINELGLQNQVFFTGFIKEHELPLAYASAKVFCFPSYAEGFGLPPLEAMASGTPVIVSDRRSLPEVCGDAAIYVNPDDPFDIAEKINSLLGSETKMKHFHDKGLEWSKRYSWNTSAQKIIDILSLS